MYEIYNIESGKVILGNLTKRQAEALRMTWVDRWFWRVRLMKESA